MEYDERRKAIDLCLSKHRWKLGEVKLVGAGSMVEYQLIRDDGIESSPRILVAEIARWSALPPADPGLPSVGTVMLLAHLLMHVKAVNKSSLARVQ